MKLSTRRKAQLRMRAKVGGYAVLGGGLYGMIADVASGEASYFLGFAKGAFIGLFITGLVVAFNWYWYQTRPGETLRKLPFTAAVLLKTVVYLLIIVAGIRLGIRLFDPTRPLAFNMLSPIFLTGVAFAVLFILVLNFVFEVNRLLGQNALANFIFGAYYRPRQEQRVFLIVDIVGSTGIAEKLGDVQFLAFLNQFYRDMSDPILEHRGEVHKYVGDEAIVTWPLERGVEDARCVHCYFGMLEAIAKRREAYRRAFGLVPDFRAALHAGPVVAGEMGELKREIVFLGDTLNTAARIAEATKDAKHPCLISGDLLKRLELPSAFAVENLGRTHLRGREQSITLFALSKSDA